MYLTNGLATALGEITLVLFTTLAPSGVMAYVLMAIPYIVRGPRLDEAMRRGIDRFLSIPLFTAMVGLVASATHLGNPANALYVISGFGSSPLSTEVVCGVVFLGSAGVFWITSFSESVEEGRRMGIRRACLAVISVFGLIFIGSIAFAYDVDTIITWSTPFVPASVWLNSLAGGPVLSLLGFRMARFHTPGHKLGKAYLTMPVLACAANVALYIAWGSTLPNTSNAITSADALAPFFGVLVTAFAVLCAASIYLSVRAVSCRGEAPLWMPISSTVCILAGIFVMRFSFYMIHMTVGLGV